jgi:ABC-type amino acid transport substrate-binding protein
MLLSVGLLSFFGSPVAAIPFLLDLFRLPMDLLALFLVAGIWCARVGDVLGVMHLAAFTLLCDAWNRGWLKLQVRRALVVTGGVSLLGVGVLWLNHFAVSASIAAVPPQRDRIAQMEPLFGLTDIAEGKPAPNPVPRRPGEGHFERIRRAGELRVGYVESNPPFSYRNANGDLVGLDVEMAWKLASELGLELRLIPFRTHTLVESLAADHFDIAVGGLVSSIENFGSYFETTPYLQLHLALLVEDHRVGEFRTREAMREIDGLRIGYIPGGRVARPEQRDLPLAEAVEVPTPQDFVGGKVPDVDALLITAEAGAIFTMIEPAYSVVIPEDTYLRVPVVITGQIGADLNELLDVWIELKLATPHAPLRSADDIVRISMAESVETRLRAIETFLPACERIGVLADAQYRQLNAKTLQIDDEFRGFIRPKHVAAPGRNFSMAACSRWRSARSTAPGRWNEWPEMTRRRPVAGSAYTYDRQVPGRGARGRTKLVPTEVVHRAARPRVAPGAGRAGRSPAPGQPAGAVPIIGARKSAN